MDSATSEKKIIVTYFDCQNIFKTVKELWGYSFPNFDPIRLSQLLVAKKTNENWLLSGVRLYTGLHNAAVNRKLHDFWSNKLLYHKTRDSRVFTFTAPLRYSNGVPREKGVDIRIALDLVKMARKRAFDVAVLFSQDNDFTEVANEIKEIASEQGRGIQIASAFPFDAKHNRIGVDRTDWIRISKLEYDSCIDPNDYRA